MSEYLVIIENSEGSYSAYSPDLPGCVAAGETIEEVRSLMREAIQMHIDSLREHGEPIPPPSSSAEYLAV
ncbi:MAG TPA: type II toxin-antitoxin system HicB family antitoxin [Actinomycetota bacterium]|nr:type II toxin-antitoxin system HicB family antitoxin [Actinomycetota bacterium]